MANTGPVLTLERKEYIANNWQQMTDYEIGKSLDLSSGSVTNLRVRMGLIRKPLIEVKSSVKAYIIESFFNDIPTRIMCKMTSLPRDKVIEIIGKNCFYVKRSYNTITMVMDSKVNYD